MSVKLTAGQFAHLNTLSTPDHIIAAPVARAAVPGQLVAYDDPAANPDAPLRSDLSALRIAEAGGAGVFLHLTYAASDAAGQNDRKKALVERVGAEAKANHLPLFLGLALPASAKDARPENILAMTREFSDPRYGAAALVLPAPVLLSAVAGFASSTPTYSEGAALTFFKAQSDATDLPYAFAGFGCPAAALEAELNFAARSGAQFNGLVAEQAVLDVLKRPLAALAQPWSPKIEVED
ncbi:hypothetical protein ACFQ3L_05695 [Lacticaseibacillus jixianensis]|uniref:Uncharacterized protein n=1 Tax=Lacticaseibacillus jixianensis TaxID=2486012 RepID=A0ABW4B8Q4_9LACO|nr:hypothetical protein [Lacticaseibacillus jixianensis]